MKTTTAAAYANFDYSAVVTLLMKLMVAFASLQTMALIVFGLSNTGLALIIGIAPIAMITSIVMLGRNWPTLIGPWSWSRFWAGLFNVARIGYERPGLKNMPWGVIFIGSIVYAIVLGIFHYELALITEHTQEEAFMVAGVESVTNLVAMPIGFAATYGVGYLFGGLRQRRLQA